MQNDKIVKMALRLSSLYERRHKIDKEIESIKNKINPFAQKESGKKEPRVKVSDNKKSEIIDLLEKNGGKMSASDIYKQTGDKGCYVMLSNMVKDGEIKRFSRGIYCLNDMENGPVSTGEINNFSVE